MLPAPTAPGQVGGHEGVGKIVKLGAGAEDSGLKIGDRVGIKWISSACGHCRAFSTLFFQNIEETNRLSRALSSWSRRCLLQPKGFRLLHPRYIPAICIRASQLCHAHSRRRRFSRGSTHALRGCHSVLRTQTQQRAPRSVGRDLRRRRRPGPYRSSTSEQGNGITRNRHRPRQ